MRYSTCYIELTSKCNLQCKHCFYEKTLNDFIEVDYIYKCIDFFYNNKVRTFWLSGGEPLLYPYFNEVIQYISSIPDLQWELVTNGTLLNEKACKALIRSQNLRCINISLDGADPEIHNYNRGEGAFDKTMEGVKRLISFGCNKIRLQMVVAKYNLTNIDRFITLAESLKVSYKILSLTDMGEAQKNALSILPYDENEARRKAGVERKKINYQCWLIKKNPIANIYIDFKGNVYLCRKFREVGISVGNIYKEIISETCLSELLEKIKLYSEDKKDCKGCSITHLCGKGCYAEAMLTQGKNDGHCKERIFDFCRMLTRGDN